MTWGFVAWIVGGTVVFLIVWSMVKSMEAFDQTNRREYLGLCRYCGEQKYTGRECRKK